MTDYQRIKRKSQDLLDAHRDRRNKLRPRLVIVREADYRLDPQSVRSSLNGCAIRDGQIVKIFSK